MLAMAMGKFYGEAATRAAYQRMVDGEAASQPETEAALCRALLRHEPSSILEVGCGSGRIYQRLRREGYQGGYAGVEMSEVVIQDNRRRFPEATWICGSGDDLPASAASWDCVFAYYVLEHCAHPERFLESLLRSVRPGGALLLTFPDFAESGVFGSQRLGLSYGNTRAHLRAGRPLHALVGLYDSRFRLPRALRRARHRFGPFPVNLDPQCLDPELPLEPDVDALYVASREEIVDWARARGLAVSFPGGSEGILRANVFIELGKPGLST
jgi:SAM-dependent methyltransferase